MSGRSKLFPPLTDTQKREIISLRSSGVGAKQIARVVDCTVDQAKHCYLSANNPQYWAKQNRAKQMVAVKARILQAMRREAAYAAQILRREIAAARAEASHAKPYKPGPLEW